MWVDSGGCGINARFRASDTTSLFNFEIEGKGVDKMSASVVYDAVVFVRRHRYLLSFPLNLQASPLPPTPRMDLIDFHGFPWISIDVHGFPWISIGFH